MPSELPSLRPKGIQATWKILVVIGAIAGVGFGAAEYLARYQTVGDAAQQHNEIKSSVTVLQKGIQENSDELEGMRYVNVRIEVAQQQVLDELRRARVEDQSTRTRAERTQREDELEQLDTRLELREKALQGSYKLRPIVPRAGSGDATVERDDPLAAAAAL